jgi:peptidyl-prolyl cis-trans isomerase B (cyclophilin B)
MKILYFLLLSIVCNVSIAQKIEVGQIKTNLGTMLIWLSDDVPNHKFHFIKKAKANYWQGSSFNRVIPNFVAQGGCPDTEQGFTDTAILIPPEFHKNIRHEYGTVGFGRDDNKAMNSATCQIYIVANKKGEYRLDDKYSIFGKIIQGHDVLDAIANSARNKKDEPLQTITMEVSIIKMSKRKIKKLLNTKKP